MDYQNEKTSNHHCLWHYSYSGMDNLSFEGEIMYFGFKWPAQRTTEEKEIIKKRSKTRFKFNPSRDYVQAETEKFLSSGKKIKQIQPVFADSDNGYGADQFLLGE